MASTHQPRIIGRIALLLICGCVAVAGCSSAGGNTTSSQASAFTTTVKTADQQFSIQFGLSPNRLGENRFSVKVAQASSGASVSNLQVRLATTMLDMDMGTYELPLQPNGPGQYGGQGSLPMAGHWQIVVLFDTPATVLHQATVKLDVAP